jgi:hypothetical protein
MCGFRYGPLRSVITNDAWILNLISTRGQQMEMTMEDKKKFRPTRIFISYTIYGCVNEADISIRTMHDLGKAKAHLDDGRYRVFELIDGVQRELLAIDLSYTTYYAD